MVMAHSLASATTPPLSSSSTSNNNCSSPPPSSLGFPQILACRQLSASNNTHVPKLVNRRSLTWGLTGAGLGLSFGGQNASGAARRPPPPPPEEKKDPNVSGVLAKVLASKKRKQAMKDVVAKLKEKGKTIDQPQPPPQ